MCGIFGLFLRPGAGVSHHQLASTLAALFRLSESRGKESAGLHLLRPNEARAWTLKAHLSATAFLRTPAYGDLVAGPLREAYSAEGTVPASPLAILAHSRLVTNGTAAENRNNQPVRWGDVTMIHNGIVVNVDALWAAHPHLSRQAQVDTEVLAALVADARRQGSGAAEATARAFSRIEGTASVAWVEAGGTLALLASNTGDLYRCTDLALGCALFASERYILEQALAHLRGAGKTAGIQWLPPGRGVLIHLGDLSEAEFSLDATGSDWPTTPPHHGRAPHQEDITVGSKTSQPLSDRRTNESLLRYNADSLLALRRCSRCVLPETFPFIEFDAQGVCNYCRAYRPRYRHLDPAAAKRGFIESLARYRRNDGRPDCLVAFSGGRDSSYGLHLIKHEFGLTPLTFTYDWGMVTDLARRNIARLCGRLGVQNILVSADIRQKRDNIRKNVAAWLNKPDLGMVPLFMAGDKHFFRVVNQIKRQTGISLDLWCANPLENTDFKTGFCGVPPDFVKKRVDYLSLGRKFRLAAYYARRFLGNPGYLNCSLLDTAGAFFAYYIEPRRDFYFVFDHMVWDEGEVNTVLRQEYDWELAPDTDSTWRIGDGTAPFYNYIYVTARGFSEFDTFRSNQIREGMIGREEALAAVLRENHPRAESMRWYLDTLGLDFDATIRRINGLDTAGLHG